jgi:hypothetical protein
MRTVLAAKSFLVAIVSLGATSFAARADCNPRDFMVRDVKSIQQSGETELAFVLTSTEEEFNNAKKGGSASGAYGLISGSANYQEAQDKARRIAQAVKFDTEAPMPRTTFRNLFRRQR